MIIDSHTHVYPAKVASRAVESIGRFYDLPMALDGTVGTLLSTADSAGVDRCLVCSAAIDGMHVHSVNEFLIKTVQSHKDRLIGFGTLHPDMSDPEAEFRYILDHGMKGIKLHPDMQRFALEDPATDIIFSLCEGICPILIHTGDKRYHYSNPSQIPSILKRHRNLQLICAHFGGYSEWDEATACLADTGVFVDCSSSFFAMSHDRIEKMIRFYGEDHVLFGSDYPMWNMNDELKTLRTINLSETAFRKITGENLKALLHL